LQPSGVSFQKVGLADVSAVHLTTHGEAKMKWTGVVAVIAVIALAVPAFAQAPGAWCGGSYGAEGTNFAPCPTAQSDPQVAGQASGIQGQSVATEPQYPASLVTFEDGKAMFNKQELHLPFVSFPDRTHEYQAGDTGTAE
jgi:hypothetical protein